MEETLSFVVRVPRQTISDLALNIHGVESVEGMSTADVASLLQDAIGTGLEDYLGESDDFAVQIARQSGDPLTFTVQIPRTTLSDLALNIHTVDSLEGVSDSDVSSLLHDVLLAGLENFLGDEVDESIAVQIAH